MLALAALLGAACAISTPALPEVQLPDVQLPTFDTAGVTRLLDDAAAEVDRLASSVSIEEIPADLAALLEEHDIRLPPLPSNAAEICAAMGTPGVSTIASAGLGEVIGTFASGGEVGIVVGLIVMVVFKTCPEWSPHVENVVQEFFERTPS